MKPGDKVVVARMDDYTLDLHEYFGTKPPIGDTGVVVRTEYNPNMAKNGHPYWALVKMDGYPWPYNMLWPQDYLDVID